MAGGKLIVDNDLLFGDVVRLLGEGRTVTIPVKGYSMLPLIRGEKDLVVLERAVEPSVGDIVLFHHCGRYILHRIIAFDGQVAVIRGDGVQKATERCGKEHIYGKVTAILRCGTRRVDPYSPGMMRIYRLWEAVRPLRRYILWLYRLPGRILRKIRSL